MRWFLFLVLAGGIAVAAPADSSPTLKRIPGVATNAPGELPVLTKEGEQIISERDALAEEAAGRSQPDPALEARALNLRSRAEKLEQSFETFARNHPRNADSLIAWSDFLTGLGDEEGAQQKLEQALKFETNNAAIYNNLANIYGHRGDVKKAFDFYFRAVSLDRTEPIYFQNFATTVYLFRKDAREFYGITEQQVFNKALDLYGKAAELGPRDFDLLSDVALTYYGIQPYRTEAALQAWNEVLQVATNQPQKESVLLHFARWNMNAGRFDQARANLEAVTSDKFSDLKKRLERNLERKETSPSN